MHATPRLCRTGATATLLLVVGCTRTASVPGAAPLPAPVIPPLRVDSVGAGDLPLPPVGVSLPAVPFVTGPIAPRVVYPTRGQSIAARDSNFIFGSVGTGDATLRINGTPVPVLPNGAFIGWLPLPPRTRPAYQLEVARGSDTVRLEHRVVLPAERPILSDSGPLRVDTASVTPRPDQAWPGVEPVRVSVRAPATTTVVLRLRDGRERALVESSAATLAMPQAAGDPQLWLADVPARDLSGPAQLRVARGRDTVWLPLPPVDLVDADGPRFGVLGAAPPDVPDTDRVVIVRPVAGGTYKWFLLPGTVVEVTGRSGASLRIRLDAELEGWVPAEEVALLPPGYAPPRRVASNARVVASGAEWSDVVVPVGDRPAYAVDVTDRGLEVTLYGVRANTDIVNHPTLDRVVRRVVWEQVTNERARFVIETHGAPWGYAVRWERGALVVRVRRAPVVNAQRPFAGLTIAVDAGHPPVGSTGPTGLYEAEATLAIAQRVQRQLEEHGARVIMTRSTMAPVALSERPVIARRANAHLFVSIHLNALPDGVNPFPAHGTGTYYFTPQSEALARQVQVGMVRRLGLRDLGINYDNLAVLRSPWMPSVLCEGAFLMMPEQEAALRTVEFQERYARGVVEGMESYLRGVVAGR